MPEPAGEAVDTGAPGLDAIVGSIGPKIRELRAQRNLSLQQLAVRAGVSAAAIHKVERGDMVPTITTLLKLASALGRPVGHFIDDAEPQYPVAVHSRARELRPGEPFTGPASQFVLTGTVTVIEPGAGGAAEPTRTAAGEELVFVLDGTLEFRVAGQAFRLARHDSLHYRTEYPRSWSNPGTKAARAIWISTS
jgi:transcriptional regulator with XRE-family HTH domain